MERIKKVTPIALGVGLLALVGVGCYWFISTVWSAFAALPATVAVATITAAATVLTSTSVVVLGRYYERVRQLEVQHLEQKIPIYEEFLEGLFAVFYAVEGGDDEREPNASQVGFLREWQRRLILWGGPDVIQAYSNWKTELSAHLGEPRADSVWRTEELLLAIRKELGNRDKKLPAGTFIGFILQHPEIFMAMWRENPNVTLAELGEMERRLTRTGDAPES